MNGSRIIQEELPDSYSQAGRKEYWNKEYAQYWKNVTDEAENSQQLHSNVQKLSGHDFKSAGTSIITSLFELIPLSREFKLLDYGCGLGRFFPYFSAKCEYYGIDISQAMIDECKACFPDASEKFIVSEGEHLPFPDNFFDVVICCGVFDACFQEQALAEMLRVVRGYVFISGKNDLYFQDDKEAYIAEVNARKKGHPNYFTDVSEMIRQISHNYCRILHQRFALRRGDYAQGKFENLLPQRFYEYMLIIQKTQDSKPQFLKFSDPYSKTWREINS